MKVPSVIIYDPCAESNMTERRKERGMKEGREEERKGGRKAENIRVLDFFLDSHWSLHHSEKRMLGMTMSLPVLL